MYIFTQDNKVGSLRTTFQQPQVSLRGLNTCNRYWIVITASDCSRSSSTDPSLIELFDNNINPYDITLTLGSRDEPCERWISVNPKAKAVDMESGLLAPTSECGFTIPCFDNSRWECTDEDSTKVTFKYDIV